MTDRARTTTTAHVSIAEGHRLFVRDWGAGPPVVLLAGWAMDSRVWGETMLLLNAHGLRTVAYDRRGHGRSTDPGAVSYDLLADDLASVLDALDLHGATLVAHSGAAGEALRYVRRHGDARIARIVLVGAMGPCMIARGDDTDGLPRAAVDGVVDELIHDLSGWIERNAAPFAPGAHARTIDALAQMVFETSRRMVVDFQRVIVDADLRHEAAALTMPVLLVHGDRDASAPIDLTARRYATLMPNARLRVCPGVAHGVMVTHATRLAEEIVAFAKTA